MRVLIAPDKFKGTLTARQAASAMARGWKRARPGDDVEQCPISDGGDGFGEVMSVLLGAHRRSVCTVDAAHRPCHARWWWEPRSRTAIVESARVIGLSLLPQGRFHPFELDTFGLGKVLESVARMKPRRCFIGIGGSATNEGGFGLARALGWRFVDRHGNEIPLWTELGYVYQILWPSKPIRLGRLIVATDVRNRLLGARGCTRVYGPQKGLRVSEISKAEDALRQLARMVRRTSCIPVDTVPGAGAAGGLGFGLMAFLNAKAESGFGLFAREAALTQRIRGANLVITGEGRMDEQTFMGKGVGELALLCREARVPCIVLNGSTRPARAPLLKAVAGIRSMTDLTSASQATARPQYWLKKLACEVARIWPEGHRFTPKRQHLGVR